MEIPYWLSRHMTAEQANSVRKAVAEVEKHTSAELVPMIVRRSILAGHVLPMLFLILLLILTLVIPLIAPYIGGVSWWAWEIGSVIVSFVAAVPLSRTRFWQRALTPKTDEVLSAMNRAQLEFYQAGIRETEGRTGVLIFVSVLERQVVILADQGVDRECPAEMWGNIIKKFVEKVRHEDFAAGFVEAITEVGAVLREKFPVRAGDKNELPNMLIIKE